MYRRFHLHLFNLLQSIDPILLLAVLHIFDGVVGSCVVVTTGETSNDLLPKNLKQLWKDMLSSFIAIVVCKRWLFTCTITI